MKLMNYLNDWIYLPNHSHPTEGDSDLYHPDTEEWLTKFTICTDPTCEIYEKARRTIQIKVVAVTVIWVVIIMVMVLMVKHMKVSALV